MENSTQNKNDANNIHKKENHINFERSVSPIECLWLAFQKSYPPFAVQFFVEGTGKLSCSEIKKAVETASDFCPGSRLVLKGNKWIDSKIPPPVHKINMPEFNGFNFENMKILNKKLNHIKGPTCEVILINTNNKSYILFRALHAIMDGMGLLLFARQVFKCLKGEHPIKADSSLTEYDVVLTQNLKFEKAERKLSPSPFGNRKIVPIRHCKWKRFTVHGSHSLITSKLASIILESSGQEMLNFMIPVDIRKYLTVGASTGNISSKLFLKIKKGTPWEEIQDELLKRLKNKQELDMDGAEQLLPLPHFFVRLYVKYLELLQLYYGKFVTSVTISNLMKVYPEEFSFSNFEAESIFFIPPHSAVPLTFTIVELPDKIEFTLTYPGLKVFEEKINKIIKNTYDFFSKESQERDVVTSVNISNTMTCCSNSFNQFNQSNNAKINTTKKYEKISVVITSTFTTDLIGNYINWWLSQFLIEANIKFTEYNQVYQSLLDDNSILSQNTDANILFIRFEDFIRNDTTSDNEKIEKLSNIFDELLSIIKNKEKKAQYFIGILPLSKNNLSDEFYNFLTNLYEKWEKSINNINKVKIIDFRKSQYLFNVKNFFDYERDKLMHMPFSKDAIAAIGTYSARHINALYKKPFKVIVLDCDNTLWDGICAENGPLGINISEQHKIFQKFLLKAQNNGFLLTICSKNNEEDVMKVFQENPNMIIKKEHISVWKVNWKSKAENIRETAEELNLGLDSFIFFDDNNVECYDVMVNCPEVLTINIPSEYSHLPFFVEHLWALDTFFVTEEDKKRASMYLAEKIRTEKTKTIKSIDEFLKTLQIKIYINTISEDDIPRVSQLTLRTNQFNFSTIRRTEDEIRNILKEKDTYGWVIEAEDRFGEYGKVGVVIAKKIEETLFIETFLLSCRVLGRKVENSIMCYLKNFCKKNGIKNISALYAPTSRNAPVSKFLEESGWNTKNIATSSNLRIDFYKNYHKNTEVCEFYINIEQIPDMIDFIEIYNTPRKCKNPTETSNKHNYEISDDYNHVYSFNSNPNYSNDESNSSLKLKNESWDIQWVNEENLLHIGYLKVLKYHCAENIVDVINQEITGSTKNIKTRKEYTPPFTETEKLLAEIWEKVLNTEKISIEDDFFSIGGDSRALIETELELSKFGISLNSIYIYRLKTIKKIAAYIDENNLIN